MSQTYYALLTAIGEAKLANAAALGTTLKITQMAVGDANGANPIPDRLQKNLIHELRRAPLNQISIDPQNGNQIIAEQVIPESVGGWWIRELGLFDADGDLIAVANCAPSYKPQLPEGSGRTQVIRMVLIVSSTDSVELKIDPSIVLATRDYADKQIAAHVAAQNPHPQYAPLDSFLSSLALSGYQKLPSGLIFQWGTQTPNINSGANLEITYPVAFPNKTLLVLPGALANFNISTWITGAASTTGVTTPEGFTLFCYTGGGAGSFCWIAIGY
ncbi:MAG: phage tail protein [Betaproteobacteria bacterium]|nr:phage tail protein [Betaproteobacteria bacterium]